MVSTNQPAHVPARMTVHEVHRPPAPVLRFVDQVASADAEAAQFRFSRSVLTDFDVDVVHVEDSNLDLLLGTRNAGAVQRLMATLALTRNLRKHRIALVRTLSGIGTAEHRRGVAALAQRLLDRATTAFVVFDESTPSPDSEHTAVIPYAHFRERFSGYPRGQQQAGRVLCLARGELPAASGRLSAIPQAANTSGLTLRYAGTATGALEQVIRSAVARHAQQVSARLELLSDGARVQEIDAAELVAVPQMETTKDLQTVFLALSLDRPVIASHNVMLDRLAEEVGPGWMHLTDGPITAASVDQAFIELRSRSSADSPNLERRDLRTVHAAYERVFRDAASQRRA